MDTRTSLGCKLRIRIWLSYVEKDNSWMSQDILRQNPKTNAIASQE